MMNHDWARNDHELERAISFGSRAASRLKEWPTTQVHLKRLVSNNNTVLMP